MFSTYEHLTNGYKIDVLDFIFLAAIFTGTLVIISKNPIVSVLFLIGLFVSVACYLMVQGTNFIGLAYLLVYVGAVSILFLFILMLINIRVSELSSHTGNSIPLCIMISVIFYSILYNVSLRQANASPNSLAKNEFSWIFNILKDKTEEELNHPLYVTAKSWDNNLSDYTHISTLGNIMYTNYFMWLILSSVILLLAMIGAIIITIKQTR